MLRALPLLRNDTRAKQLPVTGYSMLAYPWAQRYHQSNQWAIETLAMAMLDGRATRKHPSLAPAIGCRNGPNTH